MRLDHRLLWSTRHVRNKLESGGLSEGGLFGYFLAVMAFDWLQFTFIATTPAAAISDWSRASSWASFAITVIGLPYLFARNGGSKGRQFLQRYFPLSVTVGWKFVATSFGAAWLVDLALQGQGDAVRGWASTAVLAALNGAMVRRIGQHLHALARPCRLPAD